MCPSGARSHVKVSRPGTDGGAESQEWISGRTLEVPGRASSAGHAARDGGDGRGPGAVAERCCAPDRAASGIMPDTLRGSAKQARVDTGVTPGVRPRTAARPVCDLSHQRPVCRPGNSCSRGGAPVAGSVDPSGRGRACPAPGVPCLDEVTQLSSRALPHDVFHTACGRGPVGRDASRAPRRDGRGSASPSQLAPAGRLYPRPAHGRANDRF